MPGCHGRSVEPVWRERITGSALCAGAELGRDRLRALVGALAISAGDDVEGFRGDILAFQKIIDLCIRDAKGVFIRLERG